MSDQQNWQCPYCGHHQVLSKGGNIIIKNELTDIVKESKYGNIAFRVISISCLNKKCNELSLQISMVEIIIDPMYDPIYKMGAVIKSWPLLPDSVAKPQPDYIPAGIRKDYEEACKIAHLSPNASAVLARRCLQGMIRDFCGLKENTLYKEIEKLKINVAEHKVQGVTEESIQFIDSIRTMGNIGAHMEHPTGMLIDIDPDEALLLIKLIETLFKDWYVSKHEREHKLKSIKEIVTKKTLKKESKTAGRIYRNRQLD